MTLQLSARHRPRYELLTFYKFVDLPPRLLPLLAQEHLDFCRDIGLRGRVYLGREGISATVSGNRGQTHAYRLYLQASPYFHDIADIDSKASPVDGHQFPRMSVKLREEIVALGHRVTAAGKSARANSRQSSTAPSARTTSFSICATTTNTASATSNTPCRRER